ncbi:MAG: dipeptide/oligopeptide/nickel ABC transporter permease/ATP-binding protein [Acidimicrobiales bacterium]
MSADSARSELAGAPDDATRRCRVPAFLRSPGGAFGVAWLLFIVISSLTAPWWRPYDPARQDLPRRLEGPSADYWLGTDPVGRDLLSRVFTAGALPLTASAITLLVAFAIGLPMALLAAERGGRTEQVTGRVAEAIMSLPGTVVLLAAIGAIGNRIIPVMIVFGVLISSPVYRVLVGVAKSMRQRLYVDAARVNGLGSIRVNVAHVLPGMARAIAVQAALVYGIGISIVAGLAFLGFGASEPDPSWGFMIRDASRNIFDSPWLMVPPGVALALTVIAANEVADALARPLAIPEYRPSRRRPLAAATTDATHDPESVLSVRGLSVAVDDGPELVSEVSFELRQGEVLGLVGESGCGKTMTARSLLGLLPHGVSRSAGSIRWDGRELIGMSDAEMRRVRGSEIAMISQEPMVALDPLFSVKYQLTRPIRRLRGVGRREADRIALELLDQVGIVDAERVLKSYPHQLSGGMAQRVAIALALTGQPKLLVADEPTTALDVTVQAEILSLLRHLVSETGLAVVIVSHDLGVVADICDHMAVMYAGQVIESGPVAEVLDRPVHPYTMALLRANPHVADDEPVPERLAAIAGTVPKPGTWPSGCRFASRCQFVADECTRPFAARGDDHGGSALCVRADELIRIGATWSSEQRDHDVLVGQESA